MTIFQIDNSRPFISTGGLPVQWESGSGALWVLSSAVTRVSPHGILFKPLSWHLRPDLGTLPGWAEQPCAPSAYGLCQGANGSVVFPSVQTPMVSQTLDWICGATNTARLVTNESRYDPSACDILDAGYDFVLSGETLYVSNQTQMPGWMYWTVCALVVYLVLCLSKYVLASLHRDEHEAKEGTRDATHERHGGHQGKDFPNAALSILACALCTLLFTLQGDSAFVTREDLIFYWFTVLYIGAYGLLFVGTRLLVHVQRTARKDPPFYNLLAGVLQGVACRLYCSAETPYNTALLFIIATRVFVKSRRGYDALRCVTLLLDSFMLALGCTLGFSPDPHYLIALFAAAMAAADILT